MIGVVAASRRRSMIKSPWTSLGFTETHLGDGEYQFVKAGETIWDGFANLIADGDFRIRIQAQQNNVAVAVGLDEATGPVLDTGSLAEHCYLRGDGGFSGSTSYVPDSDVVYPYAANEYFWFERVGTMARILRGGDGSFATASPFYAWGSNSSDTNVLKILIRAQGGSVKVLYAPL